LRNTCSRLFRITSSAPSRQPWAVVAPTSRRCSPAAASTESRANVVVGLSVSQGELDTWTRDIRQQAETIFGPENVTVSSASIAEAGIGGFSLVVSGPADELAELDALVTQTLNDIEGITNVSSNLSQAAANGEGNGPMTFIRINQQSALSYTGELETENTIGVTAEAVNAIQSLPEIRERPHIRVSQGFTSEIQTEGFNSLPIAMMIAVVIVVTILIFTFGSRWCTGLLSFSVLSWRRWAPPWRSP
jgi:multidrug efflux pump subunit AcrB